jgi:TonB family protein
MNVAVMIYIYCLLSEYGELHDTFKKNSGNGADVIPRSIVKTCAVVIFLLLMSTAGSTGEIRIYSAVSDNPVPPGGMRIFLQYLHKNLRYPPEALDKGTGGTVYLQFIVETDGTLSELQVVRGIGDGCDEEALRLLKTSPLWTPGMHRGRAVRVRMGLPVTFSP